MTYFEYKTNPMYVQGPDALLELKRYCYGLGKNFLIITGCGPITDDVVAKVKKSFDNSMESNLQAANLRFGTAQSIAKKYDAENKEIKYEIHDYEGKQVTEANINEVTELANKMDADVIIGIGGGKALDLVRGAYHKRQMKVVLCPTSASTNAPASPLTVVYDDAGEIVGVLRMDEYPHVVLADTNLIVAAPPITLAAGIGDCMGTYFESLMDAAAKNNFKRLTATALANQHNTKEVFYSNGYKAVLSAKNKVISQAFDSVVAQIVNTDGPRGLTGSSHLPHVIDEMLLHFDQCKSILHGLLVGYGVIPALVWANYPLEDIYEYVDFAMSIGIPVTLKEVGVADEPVEKFEEYSKLAAEGPTVKFILAEPLTPEDIYKSMFIADEIVRDYLAE